MSANIQVISAHNFLYSDRHQRLYPDIRVYLEGDFDRLEPLIALLEQGKSAREICESLKLEFRGDVWFATALIYLHIRDGLASLPKLKLSFPSELEERRQKLEADWDDRNKPPPKQPEPAPRKPYVHVRSASDLEDEIRYLRSLLGSSPELRPVVNLIVERKRREQFSKLD